MIETLHPILSQLQWGRIIFFEITFIFLVMIGLGHVKMPRFMRRRQLVKGFPWGYYQDQLPNRDSYFQENDSDFMHDTGTEFGGLEGFGDYGEFSGFGELGEFGNSFFAGDAGGGGGE